ncbi:hypothetical protein JCM1840_000097 [Sporobolomyces johnsonii]
MSLTRQPQPQPNAGLQPLASASDPPPDGGAHSLTDSLRQRQLHPQLEATALRKPRSPNMGVHVPPPAPSTTTTPAQQPRRASGDTNPPQPHPHPQPIPAPMVTPPPQAQPQSYAAAAAAGASQPQAANGAPQQQQQQPQAQQPPPPGPPPAPPRPKQTIYTFPSPPPDTADLLSELEEFYSYVEVPQVLEHMRSWGEWWEGDQEFTKSSHTVQLSTISSLLSTLSSPTSPSSLRTQSARHLLHIAHGTFAPSISTSPEHHLHLVLSNCRLLREAGALEGVWDALKRAGDEWEGVSQLPNEFGIHEHQEDDDDEDRAMGMREQQRWDRGPEEEERERERQERLDEINAELALLLAVLYFMVECFRGEEQWGEELMTLEPPMPIYLFNLVAGLREKNAKGYPVKKLLLLLWKSMLCTVGGMKDVERVKLLVREIEGLPKDDHAGRPDYRPWTKVSPPDLLTFRNETLSKYPSFTPLPPSQILPLPPSMSALGSNPTTLDRISAAAAPTPVRPTFSYHINANHDPSLPSNQVVYPPPTQQPPTPAPSPPPSPAPQLHAGLQQQQQQPQQPGLPNAPPAKPKKQQFQTDQTRPFPLPFAPANAKRGRAVPRSIDEAAELYRRNLRVSTELWQAWKVREECRSEEMGWGRAEEVERELVRAEERRRAREREEQERAERGEKGGLGIRALRRRMEELAVSAGGGGESDSEGGSNAGSGSGGSAAGRASSRRGMSSIAAEEEGDDNDNDDDEDPMDPLTVLRRMGRQLRKEEEAEEDPKRRKELGERRGDLKRLERVEVLYRATLPQLQSAVIVLLKLLLATVTANQNLPNAANNTNGETDTEPRPDLTLEDCDILRHREITSKAVSAILILSLKWFKASHVMKFHYFSQLLVDSNCLLLILKMFGLQEVSTLVRVKHDRPEHNFFKFCHDHINPSPSSPRPEDLMFSAPPSGARSNSPPTSSDGGEDEIELISDYSWRNFFSTINFVHILQKLTKRKTHRVLLMVQYKSSAILKRILKVSHPTLQLYVLKVIKSQVPYCGRKWRQSNMKVITAIYLHCRPDLRDEWLAGIDVDADVEESLPHEQALRALVRFFNTKHYGRYAPLLHRRSSSAAHAHSPELHSAPAGSAPLSPAGPPPDGSAMDDVFPPPRAVSSIDLDASVPLRLAYGALDPSDDLASYEVDDLLAAGSGGALDESLASVGADGELLDWLNDPLGASDAAWERLGLEGYEGEWDDISDSESVGSWGFMRFGAEDEERRARREGETDDGDEIDERRSRHEWEHISPETITALEEERAATMAVPNSPRPQRRRSSTGPISPALRPVLIDRDDESSAATETIEQDEGPVPTNPHSGPAIDEVELIFNR